MSESNAELVERARTGDASAFETLVRRHFGAAYATALGVLGEPAEAEDASQDAFVTALERIEDCDPERFTAWLLRIVRNQAISALRRRNVRLAAPLDTAVGLASGDDPARNTDRALLRERLTAALRQLPARQREILLLHDLEGYRHREIGELLDMPEGTVRYTLFQARRAARALLGANSLTEGGHG
jgi:RNA polymerase sigma-70 factor, ECF subfamily